MKRFMILSFVPIFLLAYNSYGQHHGKGHGRWHWWEDSSVVEELKLNDEQLSKIEDIYSKYKPQLKELGSVVDQRWTAFRDIKGNPESTKEDITKSFDELWDAKYKKMKVGLEMKLEMRDVLNPDQLSKLNEIKKQHKDKMMKKHRKP
ncbi:Spy/CpxP family protein refolding chaperone [Desulfobacterota bacterium AH_259_B03_O07]|nr:Spy/CpxP family protein refolding chaperone [Desulfobacterota bacterium AH_259_B03_O07]